MSIQMKIDMWKGEKHKKWLNETFNDYINYLLKSNKSEFTIEGEIKTIIYYLRYLEENNIKKITLNSIYEYINSIDEKISLRTIYNRSQNLKYFLNYLFKNKKINFSGDMTFPKLKQPKSESIISYYNNKEISKILNSISTKTKVGKRNFAMITLFACLGIRRNEVRTLKFNNIDLEKNIIIIEQSKTNSKNILPLPYKVKYAILDYVKNSRPSIKNDYIFINEDGSLFTPNFISSTICYIVKNSGVDIRNRKLGCHIFRHSLSTNLLNNHTNINIISDVLGHSNTETTSNIYISYDKQNMMLIPLEVPEWK